MAQQRSRQDLERELEFLKKRRLVDGTAVVLNNVVRYGGTALIVYLGIARPIEALAGRVTYADVTVAVLAKLKAGDWPMWLLVSAWLVAGLAVGYGLLQRWLRRNTVERLQARIQMLEKARDPGRTSSTLTTRGDTRQEDRV